jgi:hypothetical protein
MDKTDEYKVNLDQSIKRDIFNGTDIWEYPLPPFETQKRTKNRDPFNLTLSLSDVRQYGSSVKLVCQRCGHQGHINIEKLLKRFHESTLLKEVKKVFYCSKCKARSFVLTVE